MKTRISIYLMGCWAMVAWVTGQAQDTLRIGTGSVTPSSFTWTLRQCIDYAHAHNIRVESARLSQESAQVDYQEAKAQVFPSLGFSTSQGYVHQKLENAQGDFRSKSSYSGSYGLSTGLTLYSGGKLGHSIRQQELLVRSRFYDTAVTEDEIEIAVTQAYLQILYANENLIALRQNRETSARQLERTRALLEAGSVAISDLAQMQAQHSSDRYQVTAAENTLAQAKLTLKQLLELGIDERFDIVVPEIDDDEVLEAIPSLNQVYDTALEVMPQMESSRLGIDMAILGEKIAGSSRLPTIALSAGISTGNASGTHYALGRQLDQRFYQSATVNLSIPIFTNRQVKSSVERARIQTRTAEITLYETQKSLMQTIESLHLDAISAQSRYLTSIDNVRASEISYDLVNQQYEAGIKNTVELLIEMNNLVAARQEMIQAKYQSVLSLKLLHFYQNQPIDL